MKSRHSAYPFLDLRETTARQLDEIRRAVVRVVESGWYLNGPETKAFEAELAASCGAKGAVAVANGLDALRLTLRAWLERGMIHEGDEVAVAANTYIASILPITELKLTPLLIEPDPATMNIDWKELSRRATSRTKAVMAVHLYGNPAWDEEAQNLIADRGLLLIEDNAQAIGAIAPCPGLNGSDRTGNLGHAAAFSFYPTKNVGALGDAGAVVSNDEETLSVVRAIANYGSDRRYHNIFRGWNSRMDEIQAAVLRVKLRALEEDASRRGSVAHTYLDCIDNALVTLPAETPGSRHVWHQFVVRVDDRDRFRRYLADNGVGTDVHYAVPPHLQPCYACTLGSHGITEHLADTVVSLPIANIAREDALKISDIINAFK